jgi:hypothetical protein
MELHKVVISGTLRSATPDAPVTVWERLPGQSAFHQLADVIPDGLGNYSLTTTPATDRQWYATASGLQSVAVEQSVLAAVTLKARPTKGGVVFRVAVSPSHARERVWLELRSSTGWRILARPRLDRHSRIRISLLGRFGRRGAFRAVAPADATNAESASNVVAFQQ